MSAIIECIEFIYAVFILIPNWVSTWDWGNVADWVSGLGSITALFFIYVQIKRETDHHNENKAHHFLIAIGDKPHNRNKDASGIVGISSERDLVVWGTNDGMQPSSFKYLGICTPEQFVEIIKDRKKSVITDGGPRPLDFDPEYELGFKSRKFEYVTPGNLSEEISIPFRTIQLNFKKQCHELYIVYMDQVGELYKREFGILDNDE